MSILKQTKRFWVSLPAEACIRGHAFFGIEAFGIRFVRQTQFCRRLEYHFRQSDRHYFDGQMDPRKINKCSEKSSELRAKSTKF